MEVNGLKIAVIGFHTNRACHYVNDHDTAKKLVESLSNSNDIVIVSFHGGAEGSKKLCTSPTVLKLSMVKIEGTYENLHALLSMQEQML